MGGKVMGAGAAKIAAGALSAAATIQAGYARAGQFGASEKAYEQQAKDAAKRGRYEQWRFHVMARQEVGSQMATYASLGVDMQGTAIDDLAATVKEMTIERVNALQVNRAEVRGLKLAKEEARKAKRHAKAGAILGGVSSFVSSVTSM
jgi:hypothetical protein